MADVKSESKNSSRRRGDRKGAEGRREFLTTNLTNQHEHEEKILTTKDTKEHEVLLKGHFLFVELRDLRGKTLGWFK